MENNNIINSRVILETRTQLDKTFNDLQKLKEMGIADHSALIKHNNGELLPGGAYSDYESFKDCLNLFSDVKYGDIDSLKKADMELYKSMKSMTAQEKIFAVITWNAYLRNRLVGSCMEATKNNVDMFLGIISDNDYSFDDQIKR